MKIEASVLLGDEDEEVEVHGKPDSGDLGQACANFAMTMMAKRYNLKRLVYCQRAGVMSVYRPTWVELPLPTVIRR